MSYTIEQKFISQNRSNRTLIPIGIVLHETATPNATADNEYSYFNSGYRGSSAHYFVDYLKIVQTLPNNEVGWHVGKTGNSKFIGVEMCHFEDINKFNEIWKRAVWLFANLFINVLKQTTVTTDNLLSHADVSNRWHESDHLDPISYVQKFGKSMDDFRREVREEINKQVKGDVKKVEKLIVYNGDDFRTAMIMADALKCPVCHKDNLTQETINSVKQIYVVGGSWKPTESAILVSGTDRFETVKEGLRTIGRL